MQNPEGKTQSLKEQSVWLLTAKLIGFAFSFALPLLIVRYLSLKDVGHYREAFQVISNAVIILPLGFSMSAYYFLARETDRRGSAILNILLFNFVVGGLACLALFIFPQAIGNIFRSDELTALAPAIGIVIWIWIFSTFLETVAIANSEAKAATCFIVLASFSKTLLMGSAVFAFATVEAFIYAALIQGVIQTFILLGYLHSRFPGFWRDFDSALFREQMKYSVPFGLTAILWIAQHDIHNYFVGYKFSSAEFAIYTYGCFQVPLIAMLSESVSSVLIPHMNTLQQTGDGDEMIRLTARAMQKLAFFYFPIYIFLMITSYTFVTTLFTRDYAQSVPIFMINLTLLPFGILITDPVVRSFKELGRYLLLIRVLILTALMSVLYFGLDHFGLVGMITVAVAAILIEKLASETMVIRKLGIGRRHLPLLKNVGKTAVISLIAGFVTYIFYFYTHEFIHEFGRQFAERVFSTTSIRKMNFTGGTLVLLVSGLIFAPIYLMAANFWGVMEEEEKKSVIKILSRFLPKRIVRPATEVKS